MERKDIYEEMVSYYIDADRALWIHVGSCSVAHVSDVKENDTEYLNRLVDEVLYDLGYRYIK